MLGPGLPAVPIDTDVAISPYGGRQIVGRDENRWINWLSLPYRTMIESRSVGFGAFPKWLNGLWETLKGK
jgi:hypothetical protein